MPKSSMIRDFTQWWFAPPSSPWFCVSFDVDVGDTVAYLARLRERDDQAGVPAERRVSVNHVVVGAVARTLARYPEANARIIGGRVFDNPHVGVAMPVNLLGHEEGEQRELSVIVLERAEQRSLREIAVRSRKVVDAERRGDVDNAFMRALMLTLGRIPTRGMHAGLDVFDAVMRRPALAQQVYARIPATTAVTNPGSVFAGVEGIYVRGGAMSVPHRLVHVGTVWGTGPITDGVVPVDGEPGIRPLLPFTLAFDHRLIDGVRAGQLVVSLTQLLRDPEGKFGVDGEG